MIITSNNKQKNSIISISDEAREKLIALMKEEGLDPKEDFVRCGVNPGGCSGLSYELAFEKASETQLNQEDEIYSLGNLEKIEDQDEGYFSDSSDEVEVFKSSQINVLINKASKLYLAGCKLKYAGGLNGKGFYFNNPNARRTCGCGESFSS